MDIFISHKDVDAVAAKELKRKLESLGHNAYLDVVDNEINKQGVDLADYLRDKMSKCNALIAVISKATQTSWWVPWEIGVATEKGFPLSTFHADISAIPEYLHKWPILKTDTDLRQYAALVGTVGNRSENIRLSQRKSIEESRLIAASEFHSELKRKIGQ